MNPPAARVLEYLQPAVPAPAQWERLLVLKRRYEFLAKPIPSHPK